MPSPELAYACYVLRDEHGTPFYVGSGSFKRLSSWARNRPKVKEKLDQMDRDGHPRHREVFYFATAEAAKAKELELQNQFGMENLLNERLGDRGGVHGRKLSPEHSAKLQAWKYAKKEGEEN